MDNNQTIIHTWQQQYGAAKGERPNLYQSEFKSKNMPLFVAFKYASRRSSMRNFLPRYEWSLSFRQKAFQLPCHEVVLESIESIIAEANIFSANLDFSKKNPGAASVDGANFWWCYVQQEEGCPAASSDSQQTVATVPVCDLCCQRCLTGPKYVGRTTVEKTVAHGSSTRGSRKRLWGYSRPSRTQLNCCLEKFYKIKLKKFSIGFRRSAPPLKNFSTQFYS